jgi:hypothetical protein
MNHLSFNWNISDRSCRSGGVSLGPSFSGVQASSNLVSSDLIWETWKRNAAAQIITYYIVLHPESSQQWKEITIAYVEQGQIEGGESVRVHECAKHRRMRQFAGLYLRHSFRALMTRSGEIRRQIRIDGGVMALTRDDE